jgi:NTE family protein
MSGGGARGAYEAGVLGFVLDELPHRLGRPVRFQIVTGTSVGAIHACYVAGTQGRGDAGRALMEIWRSLEVGGVYRVGIADALGIPLGPRSLASRHGAGEHGILSLSGLLDTALPGRLVQESIP